MMFETTFVKGGWVGLLLILLLSGCTSLGMTTIPDEELKAKYCNEYSKFIQVDDMEIHYRDEGSGPVLVLIHGVCASLQTWDGWVAKLKDHYRIIRLDLPGFGLSTLPDINVYDLEKGPVFLDDFFKALNLQRVNLAGNSLGGYISWLYAAKYPDKVDKLILVDAAGYEMDMPSVLSFASNPVIRPFSRRIMPRFMINGAVEEVYGDESKITQEVRDRYFELAMREGGKSNWVDIFTMLRELPMEKISRGIQNIKAPTLVMWGTKDTWIPYDPHFLNWQKGLPGATFIAYEGAGHVPMEEIPDKTARDADLFLSGQMAPSGGVVTTK